jgi:hypothetical protein
MKISGDICICRQKTKVKNCLRIVARRYRSATTNIDINNFGGDYGPSDLDVADIT